MERKLSHGLLSPSETSTTSTPAPKIKRRRSSTVKSVNRRSSERGDPLLACLNCRQKKVKCQPGVDGCSRCYKLGLQCVEPETDERKRPSSKTHIRQLCDRITHLEEELRKARHGPTSTSSETSPPTAESGDSPDTAVEASSPKQLLHPDSQPRKSTKPGSDSLIAQLCGGTQWQLNRDEGGQLHFYGPTSSLHLTETRTSSLLQWGGSNPGSDHRVQDVSQDLQAYLMDLYWKYQHEVLAVFHKEAFLNDFATGQTRYCSKLLLYCIFACAARISPRPDIRALAIPTEEDLEDEQPYLVRKANQLLEQELKRPQITTIHSLLLLSVIDCARSHDTKGWLFTGNACRLACDLGLHRDCSGLDSPDRLSQIDLEARSVTFWSCFVFDRLWAMYLGRPHGIKLDDVTVPQPSAFTDSNSPLEMKMAAAWADIMEITGHICDALNGNNLSVEKAHCLNKNLRDWYSNLDESLRYKPQTTPALFVLHMQYYSASILLNRPTAGFGVSTPPPKSAVPDLSDVTHQSRSTCVKSAIHVAEILDAYAKQHGDALSMSGVGLHPISTAATILIAEIVDRKGTSSTASRYGSTTEEHFRCLRRCIKSLSELEKTYLVARRVRKIVRMVMRLCNLGDGQPHQSARSGESKPGDNPTTTGPGVSSPGFEATVPQQQHYHRENHDQYDQQQLNGMESAVMLPPTTHHSHPAYDLNFLTMMDQGNTAIPSLPAWDTSWAAHDLFAIDETMPTTSQMDILCSFESFFGNGYGG